MQVSKIEEEEAISFLSLFKPKGYFYLFVPPLQCYLLVCAVDLSREIEDRWQWPMELPLCSVDP
jgi:hypothetical protein